MIKRITITIAAAALFAVPAQSASAAIDVERPNAQEMEHGIAPPSYGGGTSTPPSSETTEPEAVESVPAPSEQGRSPQPGLAPETEPVIEPESPETAQQNEPEADDADGPTCDQLARQSDLADAFAEVGLALGNALGPVLGSTLRKEGILWAKESIRNDEEAEKKGCNAEEEAPA
jgi:hypothetical protein